MAPTIKARKAALTLAAAARCGLAKWAQMKVAMVPPSLINLTPPAIVAWWPSFVSTMLWLCRYAAAFLRARGQRWRARRAMVPVGMEAHGGTCA